MGARGLHESLLVLVEGMADVEDARLAGLSKASFLVLFIGFESQIFGEVLAVFVSKAALSMASLATVVS